MRADAAHPDRDAASGSDADATLQRGDTQSQRSLQADARSLRCCCVADRDRIVAVRDAPAVQPSPVFRSGTELVLVNVVVRDRSGNVVRGLTRDDFTVTEDDKPQTITSFDFEELDQARRRRDAAPAAPAILPQRAGRARRPTRRRRRRRREGRHARPAADRAVLRLELDAARGDAARGQGGARLRRAEAVAGRPDRRRVVLDRARASIRTSPPTASELDDGDRSRSAARAARASRPATPASRRHAGQRHRVHARTTPSSTSSTPTGASTRCSRCPTRWRGSSRRSRSSTSAAA